MARQYPALTEPLVDFIGRQRLFFVATAADGRINLSPKGLDTLRILTDRRVVWLNLTGSGNETAAHLQTHARMTLMFCAFEGEPLILRLYGQARACHRRDPHFAKLQALFATLPPSVLQGSRQIFDLAIDLVQTSCGFGVPRYEYAGDRPDLEAWTQKKGAEGLRRYWRDKNATSIDGVATDIVAQNDDP
ncbi:MAG: pyridoxamine 5'-phosphate oxidase family protein [Acidiferrobacter sp.]